MIRSRKYFPCGTWTTSSQGKPVDQHMHRAWHMMVTRPHDVQLEHIGILFWGTHLSQPGGKFRYFITAAPDGADSLLTKGQLASEQLFFRHAYEIETTLMVCADVRKCSLLTSAGMVMLHWKHRWSPGLKTASGRRSPVNSNKTAQH
jgi:hypothetical protein